MNSNTFKNLCIELLSVSEYIQLKSKIKTLEVHQNLPWVVFSDLENNIMIFDIIEKKPIRAFNIQNFFQEQVTIKDIKFFNINDKQYIMNYDLNEIKKIKGIPFHIRSNLLIITLEKCICFYSYITQSYIKTIVSNEIEQKLPIKCELFNFMYLIVQTNDGCLMIWNILDWNLVKKIDKTTLGKPVCNFIVISTKNEEKFIAVANTNGNLFLIDISKKDVLLGKLECDKVYSIINLKIIF
jgi:WD40 repeat protein